MTGKTILLMGLDPKLLTFRPEGGLSTASVSAAGASATSVLEGLGHEVHTCLLDPAEASAQPLLDALAAHAFDCIMIGAGLRALTDHTLLFERSINAIHEKAPSARICFNVSPDTTVDAVLRWI